MLKGCLTQLGSLYGVIMSGIPKVDFIQLSWDILSTECVLVVWSPCSLTLHLQWSSSGAVYDPPVNIKCQFLSCGALAPAAAHSRQILKGIGGWNRWRFVEEMVSSPPFSFFPHQAKVPPEAVCKFHLKPHPGGKKLACVYHYCNCLALLALNWLLSEAAGWSRRSRCGDPPPYLELLHHLLPPSHPLYFKQEE